jgi:hypothetical protein
MLTIDWGDVGPSSIERSTIEARLNHVSPLIGSTVSLRRCGAGFEAQLRLPLREHATELRLHDEDVGLAVDRLVQLLEIVANERARTAS